MPQHAITSCTPQRDAFVSPLTEAQPPSASTTPDTPQSSNSGSNQPLSETLGTVEAQTPALPDRWPVLADKITLICYVVGADGQSVSAATVLANYFHYVSQDISTRDGSVLREHGTEALTNPLNGTVAKLWATEDRLMVTVNPTSWVQGHAAFCPLNPQEVIRRTVAELLAILSVPGLTIRPSHLSLLHVTAMFDAGCPRIARRLLEALKSAASKGRSEVTTYRNSIYFGQHSSLKSLKIYLDPTKEAYGYLEPHYMGRMLRAEAVLRNLGRQYGQDSRSWFDEFYRTDLAQLLWDEVMKIRCYTSQIALMHLPEILTNAELGIYLRWQNHCLPTARRGYRRLRNSILANIGIDVFVPYREAIADSVQDELSFYALFNAHNVSASDHRREMMHGRVVDGRLANLTRGDLATLDSGVAG